MKVASLQFNPICENTYVVWDDTNECIVVDAGNSDERENARLKEFIDSRGLHPRMAVNTHGHFDHTLGVQFLKDTYGIPFALSGKDKFLLDNAAPGSSIFGVKVGREYRVAKTTVMEFIQDRRTPDGYQKCVGSVTSNPKGWTSGKKSDMLCATGAKEA